MKTIAIVINTTWNIYNFRLGLLRSLQEDGYRIVLIAPTDEYVEKLECFGFEHYNITINNKGTNPIEDSKLIFAFYKLYKAIKPDILLHYTIKPNIYGTIAAKFLNIPVIANISGLGTVFLNEKMSSKLARLLYKFTLRIPKHIFFQNLDDRKLFLDLALVNKNVSSVLPGSGINTEKFAPIKRISKFSPTSFLFIARLVRDKGLIEYVSAARLLKDKYPDVHFLVLGSFYPGNPTAILPTEMAKWEDEGIIEYLGASDDVALVIDSVDCVVLPSYREGLSRVLLEAASMAKPIVTTDVPGCRDLVDNGVNGFLCKSKDPVDLALQIERMILLSPSKRVEMGEKGRKKVIKGFDESIVVERYKALIFEILNDL